MENKMLNIKKRKGFNKQCFFLKGKLKTNNKNK